MSNSYSQEDLKMLQSNFQKLIDYVKKYVKGNSFILDSEAVGFDKKTKEYQAISEHKPENKKKI